MFAGIDVDDSGEQFAAGELEYEFGGSAGSELRHFRIGAAAEAGGGFGVKFERAGGAANGDGIEPGALDQNIFGGKRDFGFGAAHDAADAHDARAVTIADYTDAGIELALDAIQSFNFPPCGIRCAGGAGIRAAHNDSVVAYFVVVEGVQRVAKLQHDVIGDVDDVVDAGNAASFEPVFEPRWRRLNFYAADYARGETPA